MNSFKAKNNLLCVHKYSIDASHETRVFPLYEGWNFNSGNYLFTTDTK